jgi:hypothetical protein
MSRTIKDYPWDVRKYYEAGYEHAPKNIRAARRSQRKKGYHTIGSWDAWTAHRDEIDWLDASDEKVRWRWYESAPKEFRKTLQRRFRAKTRDATAHEDYDLCPRFRRNAAWLYW